MSENYTIISYIPGIEDSRANNKNIRLDLSKYISNCQITVKGNLISDRIINLDHLYPLFEYLKVDSYPMNYYTQYNLASYDYVNTEINKTKNSFENTFRNHKHNINDVYYLTETLNNKAHINHKHNIEDIEDFDTYKFNVSQINNLDNYIRNFLTDVTLTVGEHYHNDIYPQLINLQVANQIMTQNGQYNLAKFDHKHETTDINGLTDLIRTYVSTNTITNNTIINNSQYIDSYYMLAIRSDIECHGKTKTWSWIDENDNITNNFDLWSNEEFCGWSYEYMNDNYDNDLPKQNDNDNFSNLPVLRFSLKTIPIFDLSFLKNRSDIYTNDTTNSSNINKNIIILFISHPSVIYFYDDKEKIRLYRPSKITNLDFDEAKKHSLLIPGSSFRDDDQTCIPIYTKIGDIIIVSKSSTRQLLLCPLGDFDV